MKKILITAAYSKDKHIRLVGGARRPPGEAGAEAPFRHGVRREGLPRRWASGLGGGRAL